MARRSFCWLSLVSHVIVRGYFGRVRAIGREVLPTAGLQLFVGLHRNGAVDGWVYRAALGRPLVFMLSAQLRRHPILAVVPVSVGYGLPWAMGEGAEVLVGFPVVVDAESIGRGRAAVVMVEETKLPGARDLLVVPRPHGLVDNHPDSVRTVLAFLKHGRFVPSRP